MPLGWPMQVTRAGRSYWSTAVLLPVAVAASVSGCAQPDAASTDRPGPGDQFPPNLVLDPRDQATVLAAMREAGAGVEVRPLVTADGGVRWSDVEMAIRNVADDQFLGVARVDAGPNVVTASLQTEDGQPCTVTVRKSADGRIAAKVDIGVFANIPREHRFERAFEDELRRLGTIPRPR